jgi:hypothetical protein
MWRSGEIDAIPVRRGVSQALASFGTRSCPRVEFFEQAGVTVDLALTERVLPRAAGNRVNAPRFSDSRTIGDGNERLVDLTGIEPVTS